VIATGKTHSIREFLDEAFKVAGIQNWPKHIKQDSRFVRPAEVDVLRGDSTKAKKLLGWEPMVEFKELVSRMVINDLKKLENK